MFITRGCGWLIALVLCATWAGASDAAAHPIDEPLGMAPHDEEAWNAEAVDGIRSWTNLHTGEVVRGSFMAARGGKVVIERESGGVVVLAIDGLPDAERSEVAERLEAARGINERRGGALAKLVQPAAVGGERRSGDEKQPGVGNAGRKQPAQAAAFAAFAPTVSVRWDDKFLFVESAGMPAHNMMVGITAWQQQVPLPQAYTGANAWRITLAPVPAATPVSIKGRFLRGAIALAANGIPIFNPQNNRGEVSADIGELDQWGGHCGRADDYHYHAAPLHLQDKVGKDQPIAYALDGYAIYGLTEPDGAVPVELDGLNGHSTAALGYHYHASMKYPFVNGGFHGEVVEREGQVDPQPRAQSGRPAGEPLRGAKITGFDGSEKDGYTLSYSVGGQKLAVRYAQGENGSWKFSYVGGDGKVREENYAAGGQRGGGEAGPGGGERRRDGGRPGDAAPKADKPADAAPAGKPIESAAALGKQSSTFKLTSSAIGADGVLPKEFTGDGEAATVPLEWTGAPARTKGYVVIMHHIDPGGNAKWYWTLYDIPAETASLPKNVSGVGKGVGTLGTNSVNDRREYAPPHSKGPGEKTYVLTVYALSAPLNLTVAAEKVTRAVLLEAMKDITLGSAELKVTYTRSGAAADEGEKRPPRRGGGGGPDGRPGPPPDRPDDRPAPPPVPK